ncbi:hypothetical protein Mal4_24420 [Maioricimonas rarisocia]|uniref:Lipocalin-like domain-containing protein n=1 Tax=Maioricimonas rarisocia TaxID=2528026 RepID=A0A517Z6K0_9PLAN|nr:TIGR03067 domain-containing protein [Maioricimonas rarisocia]QDU38120.1 hypothetical protein Mal4_24420 [Maioricimonas rarisocia]
MRAQIRHFSLVALLLLIGVPAVAEDAQSKDAERTSGPASEQEAIQALQGNWRLVDVTFDGEPSDGTLPDQLLTVRGRNVHFRHGDGSEHESQRMYSVNPHREPAELTMYGDNFLIQAIYRIDGHRLTIAFHGRSEQARPESFEADGTSEAGPLCTWTYRRVE